MRLAYQDMSMERQKEEDKMRKVDPKKAQQMERLGMGMTGTRYTPQSTVQSQSSSR